MLWFSKRKNVDAVRYEITRITNNFQSITEREVFIPRFELGFDIKNDRLRLFRTDSSRYDFPTSSGSSGSSGSVSSISTIKSIQFQMPGKTAKLLNKLLQQSIQLENSKQSLVRQCGMIIDTQF